MSGQQAAQAPVCQYLRPLALSGGGLESVCVWVETKHPPCLFGEILPCCSAQNIVGNQQDLASRPSLVTDLWRDLKQPSPPAPTSLGSACSVGPGPGLQPTLELAGDPPTARPQLCRPFRNPLPRPLPL